MVIPVYDAEQTAGLCLASVYASTFRDFEVIVVDDCSRDNTAAVIADYPCEVLRCVANSGPAAARNLGAAHARGRILFFLDADILVQPESLGEIDAAFARRHELSALFGSYHADSIATNFFSRFKNLLHHYTHQTACETASTFCGGFGAITRAAFFDVGGFDASCRFLEDVEMGERLSRAGHPIWLDKRLQFFHCKRYTLSSLVRSDFYGRAVPWTRLILSTRTLRNDLNTRTHNVCSVPLSFLLLFSLPDLFSPAGAALWVAMFALLLFLNRGFLWFVWKQRGPMFASAAALMCWFVYLYSGVGVAVGTWDHFVAQRRTGMVIENEAEGETEGSV